MTGSATFGHVATRRPLDNTDWRCDGCALVRIHATLVAATWGKALTGDLQGGMANSCPQYPLLCRDSGGQMHPCVYMTAWPIFQPLALVLFVTDVNRLGAFF
jgi:hypothetical protein